MRVGTATMATIMDSELRKEAQKLASPMSSA